MKKLFVLSCIASSVLLAQSSFTLGEISIQDNNGVKYDTNKITSQTLENSASKDISEVLDKTTGITLVNRGGRVEKSVNIRGFDSNRIGMFLDGIPIYVPYDGQFDYSRILTTQLDSIDIAKGFSSSLYGSNTLGGVINLVSKKPTKEFEGSFTTQINADSDWEKSSNMYNIYLGSKKEKYYYQVNATLEDREHWTLSNDADVNDYKRENSDTKQKAVSAKVGFTPDDTSEYVFGYSYMDSQKGQPPTIDPTISNEKYWKWPVWDTRTMYFIANKNYTDSSVKFKLYRNDYEYKTDYYKDETYSTSKGFYDSDDNTKGTALEYTNFGLLDNHILKTAISYKKDSHIGTETNINKKGKISTTKEDLADHVYSIAFEDIFFATEKLKVITSASYDYTRASRVDTTATEVEKKSNNAFNPQIGFFYDISKNQQVSLKASRKSHLPTMKERYSDKKGKAIPNPELDPEIATHYEVAHKIKVNNFTFNNALFYTKVKDAIINKTLDNGKRQEQNSADERYKGIETSINYQTNLFSTGLNYTYTNIKKDSEDEVEKLPKHQFYIYANYKPVKNVILEANYTYKKDFYLENEVSKDYVKASNISLTNFNAKYIYSKTLSFKIGIENLFDKNYEYDLGYPEKGREFYASLKYNF